MNIRVRMAIIVFTLLVCLGSLISLSLASYSPSRLATSGTIIYNDAPTYIVSTLTDFTNVLSKVVPGDVVYIRGGIYRPTSRITFTKSGTSAKPITFEAYPGEEVIFDGSSVSNSFVISVGSPWTQGVNGNWNVLKNFRVMNCPTDCGILIWGNDCVLDHIEMDHNAGMGGCSFGLRNKFLYCVAHDNVDSQNSIPGGNADGLGAQNNRSPAFSARDTQFIGCLVYGNSDDGIDLYGSQNSILQDCVAYGNGRLQGNGNGFKLTGSTNATVIGCIAYNNLRAGFTVTQGCPSAHVDRCTAYNNPYAGIEDAFISGHIYTNNICANNAGGNFRVWRSTPVNHNNSWNYAITNFGFNSTNPSSSYFLSLSANSACRGRATDGSDLGALQYGEMLSDLLG